MITTNTTSKVAIAVLGLALALSAFAFAPAAHAQTAAELQAQIQSLLATIAQLQAQLSGVSGGSGAGYTYTRDLTIGSTGADVTALQNMLIAAGNSIPAGATGYFGAQTQAALAAYQAKNGISPASGYFGPITRAKVNATAGTGTGTTGGTTLEGGEGSLKDFSELGDADTSINEGESGVKVLGIEFEADDSDMSIERLDVEFDTHSGNGSTKLSRYVDSVSLIFNGKKVAELDVDEASEDTNNVYSFRFSGLDLVTEEGDTSSAYVAVDVVSNLDSTDDADTWDVEIPVNGIRAVDGAGISETYPASALEETVTWNSADTGTVSISEADANPDDHIVVVESSADTNDVTLMVFDLKVENQSVTIDDLPIGFTVTGASNVGDVVKNVRLMDGSKVLKSKSVPSSAGTYEEVVFNDMDYTVDEDEEVTLKVVVDIPGTDTALDVGDTVYATITGASGSWDVEDANGEAVTPSSSLTGSVATVYESGIAVAFSSAEENRTNGSIAGDPDSVEYKIHFKVTAIGDDDVYVDGDVIQGTSTPGAYTDGLSWATTTDSTNGSGTYTGILTADNGYGTNDTNSSGDKRFKINSGNSRNFTFTVSIPAGGDNVAAGVKITGLLWDTTSQDDMTYFYDDAITDLVTDVVTGLYIR